MPDKIKELETRIARIEEFILSQIKGDAIIAPEIWPIPSVPKKVVSSFSFQDFLDNHMPCSECQNNPEYIFHFSAYIDNQEWIAVLSYQNVSLEMLWLSYPERL